MASMRVTASALAIATTFWTMSTHAEDQATFLSSIQSLARSTRPASDPAFLVGIGQIFCQMRVVVTDEPLRPEMVLAVLHQKHPDTQPKSNAEREAQRKAMVLAATFLCPEEPQSVSTPVSN